MCKPTDCVSPQPVMSLPMPHPHAPLLIMPDWIGLSTIFIPPACELDHISSTDGEQNERMRSM